MVHNKTGHVSLVLEVWYLNIDVALQLLILMEPLVEKLLVVSELLLIDSNLNIAFTIQCVFSHRVSSILKHLLVQVWVVLFVNYILLRNDLVIAVSAWLH
jgi:hypothetical protein